MNIIREAREKKKLTQCELARRSGVKQSVISDIENGKTPNPRVGTIKALAVILGFDWTRFYKEEG